MTNIVVNIDLSRYTVNQLNSLLMEKIITKEEYNTELESRNLIENDDAENISN